MESDNHIEQLLQKYWNTETSLEEEKELRDFFTGGSMDNAAGAKWKETGELFKYYEQQKHLPLSGSDFDEAVISKIRKNEPRGKSIRMLTYVARIAAGLIVVAVATYLVRQEIRKSYPQEIVDTYSDPKLALEETKKAFMLISKSFGKAQQEAKSINLLNKAEEKIGEKKTEKKQESNI